MTRHGFHLYVFWDAHPSPVRIEMPISNRNKAVFKQETETIIQEITHFHMLMYGTVYTYILYEEINSDFTLSATFCSMISCYYFSGILQVHPRPLKSCKYIIFVLLSTVPKFPAKYWHMNLVAIFDPQLLTCLFAFYVLWKLFFFLSHPTWFDH